MHHSKRAILAALLAFFAFAPVGASASFVHGEWLGTFRGNDSEAAIERELGLIVRELSKVDIPATATANLSLSELSFKEKSEPVSGRWEYTGSGVANLIVVKAGPQFAVYRFSENITDGMRNAGLWDTAQLGNKGLSHLTAYTVVPVPAAAWLLASALLALGLRKRRS